MINWSPNFFLPPTVERSLRGKDPALAFSGNGGRFFLTVTPTGKPDDFEAVLWNLVGEGRNKKYLVAAQAIGPFSRKGGFPEVRFVAAWADKEAKKRKLERKMTSTPNAEKMIEERLGEVQWVGSDESARERMKFFTDLLMRYANNSLAWMNSKPGGTLINSKGGLAVEVDAGSTKDAVWYVDNYLKTRTGKRLWNIMKSNRISAEPTKNGLIFVPENPLLDKKWKRLLTDPKNLGM